MRIARFTTGDEPRFAIVDGEPGHEELVVLTGDPMYTPGNLTGERIPLDDNVRLLAPVIPRSKAVCIGRNYAEHAREFGNDPVEGELPVIFLKPNTAVIGPDDPIVLPAWSDNVQHEVELAIVIKGLAKNVSPENAAQYIYGYTVANDVTARDLQKQENQWFRAKAFDTSLPLGPWIETDLPWEDLNLAARVNGETRQAGNTSEMIHDPLSIVAMVSEVVTLLPGDIVLTGTPAGVSALNHGDVVEAEVEGVGVLRNPVVRR